MLDFKVRGPHFVEPIDPSVVSTRFWVLMDVFIRWGTQILSFAFRSFEQPPSPHLSRVLTKLLELLSRRIYSKISFKMNSVEV